MDKTQLNRLRRMAGAPVDYSPTPKAPTSLVEDGIPGISQVFRGGESKFYLVCDADDKSDLGDVLTELDFPALVNILKTAKDTKEWELFPISQKNKALDLARKRLATVTESIGQGAGGNESTPYPTDEEIDQAVTGFEDEVEDDFEPSTNICPDCEGGEHPPMDGVCERCGGEGEIFESKEEDEQCEVCTDCDCDPCECAKEEEEEVKTCKCGCDPAKCKCPEDCKCGCNAKEEECEMTESAHYHTDGNYPLSHENDDTRPVNVVDSETENVFDLDPDHAPDDYHPTNDTTPCKVPTRVLSELKRVIDEVTAECEKAKPRDFERAHYYEATAEAMQIVHDLLAEKTVQGLKKAQYYVHRMANVSRALLPDLVWKFIVDGGEKRSLKSYYNEVKEPVLGKPFDNVGISTLNKNTNTE